MKQAQAGRRRARALWSVLAAVLSVGTFAPSALAQTASTPVPVPVPVILDTDMDFDDSAALAYLAGLHKQGLIALQAVTVTSAGNGYSGSAIRHARCILQRAGLPQIPVADSTTLGVHAFPPEALFEQDFLDGLNER